MTKALYIVIQSLENWWVDFEGRGYGPYSSREEAALEGRTLAQFRAHERPSEVLVPDGEGKYWIVWSSQGAAAGVPRPVSVPPARNAA